MVSDPVENRDGEKGFLDEARIRRLVPDFAERTSYICGPQIMNDFCKSALEAMGVPEKRIRREMFGARKDIQNEPGWLAELSGDEVFTITVGERKIPVKSGESVLVALERAGVRVNVCCRSGECSLCRVKLVSGIGDLVGKGSDGLAPSFPHRPEPRKVQMGMTHCRKRQSGVRGSLQYRSQRRPPRLGRLLLSGEAFVQQGSKLCSALGILLCYSCYALPIPATLSCWHLILLSG